MRKIKQIAVSTCFVDCGSDDRGENETMLALCEDGSLWRYIRAGEWTQLEGIPDNPEQEPHEVSDET